MGKKIQEFLYLSMLFLITCSAKYHSILCWKILFYFLFSSIYLFLLLLTYNFSSCSSLWHLFRPCGVQLLQRSSKLTSVFCIIWQRKLKLFQKMELGHEKAQIWNISTNFWYFIIKAWFCYWTMKLVVIFFSYC